VNKRIELAEKMAKLLILLKYNKIDTDLSCRFKFEKYNMGFDWKIGDKDGL